MGRASVGTIILVTDGQGASDPIDVEATVEALYGRPPSGFTAARDESVRALKTAGQTKDAAAVKALRKPSLAAWALNLLVREDRVQVDALLAVGDELRRAQRDLSGDDLRSLTGQRHRVVRAVAQRAGQLAADAGHPLPTAALDQVAASLDAAMADSEAAATLVSGRVTSPLTYAGLGGDAPAPEGAALRVVVDGAAPDKDSAPPADKARRRQAIKQAERRLTDATAELDEADERLARAKDAAAASHLRVASAEQTLEAAQAELEAAQGEEETAERAATMAAKQQGRAAARVTTAQEQLSAAKGHP